MKMTTPEPLELPVAQPDYEAQDEMSEWAVEHAEELAALDDAAHLKGHP
jgi:hypothetical protein